jgi:hypothetical protein
MKTEHNSPPITANLTPTKKHSGGRERKLTAQTVLNVAQKVAKGVPLKFACATESQPVSLKHFQRNLELRPDLLALYNKTLGTWIENAVDKIAAGTLKTMPGEVWLLERRVGEYFSSKSTGSVVNVNVQTCVGLSDDIPKRARVFVKGATPIAPPRKPGASYLLPENGEP